MGRGKVHGELGEPCPVWKGAPRTPSPGSLVGMGSQDTRTFRSSSEPPDFEKYIEESFTTIMSK